MTGAPRFPVAAAPTSAPIVVTEVHFARAKDYDVRRGLLGFVKFVLNGAFAIDTGCVHLGLDGEPRLSFSGERKASGRVVYAFRPITEAARRELERQVFAALNIKQEVAP